MYNVTTIIIRNNVTTNFTNVVWEWNDIWGYSLTNWYWTIPAFIIFWWLFLKYVAPFIQVIMSGWGRGG